MFSISANGVAHNGKSWIAVAVGTVGRMLESHHKSYFGVIPYTLVKCFCLSIYISFRMKYHILWIFVSSLLFVCLYTMSVRAGVESPALRMQP